MVNNNTTKTKSDGIDLIRRTNPVACAAKKSCCTWVTISNERDDT